MSLSNVLQLKSSNPNYMFTLKKKTKEKKNRSKFSCRIHKEQMEKWQEEIKDLRLLDASNEEANALLHNARHLLHNAHIDS